MTHVDEKGNVWVIDEPPGRCELCGAVQETRPYGPNGEQICHGCGMKDTAATEKMMGCLLFGEDAPQQTVGDMAAPTTDDDDDDGYVLLPVRELAELEAEVERLRVIVEAAQALIDDSSWPRMSGVPSSPMHRWERLRSLLEQKAVSEQRIYTRTLGRCECSVHGEYRLPGVPMCPDCIDEAWRERDEARARVAELEAEVAYLRPFESRAAAAQAASRVAELEAALSEYAEHHSWRCQYRKRYKTCQCGLDETMVALGFAPVPVDDPEREPKT